MEWLVNIVHYVVPFLILLGVLVFVHEFGHFIVARMTGVNVSAFSIGFGKELWSVKDKKGTVWKISAIPLGGYLLVASRMPSPPWRGIHGRRHCRLE